MVLIVCVEVDYELDVANDEFWRKSLNTPFPYVAENMEKEVEKWQQQYNEMGHKKISTETDVN